MTIADDSLNELLQLLSPAQRQAVEEMLKGKRSDEAAAVMRWLRRKLKRKVRAKKK